MAEIETEPTKNGAKKRKNEEESVETAASVADQKGK